MNQKQEWVKDLKALSHAITTLADWVEQNCPATEDENLVTTADVVQDLHVQANVASALAYDIRLTE